MNTNIMNSNPIHSQLPFTQHSPGRQDILLNMERQGSGSSWNGLSSPGRSVFGRKMLYVVLVLVGNMFFVGALNAQIVQRGSSTTAVWTSGSSISIITPTGVVAGDVMIVNLAIKSGGSPVTLPSTSGWTLISNDALYESGGQHHHGAALYRVATGNEGGNTITINVGAITGGATATIVAFSGVSTTGGFDGAGASNSGPFDAAPNPWTLATGNSDPSNVTAVSTATTNALVIMLVSAQDDAGTVSGWTTATFGSLNTGSYSNAASAGTVGAGWKIKSGTGSTGVGAASLSSNKRNGAILLALRPQPATSTMNANTVGAETICAGTLKVPVQSFSIVQTGANANMTGLSFTTTGTYAATGDITKFQLWTNTINLFSDPGTSQVGIDLSTALGTGAHAFASFSQTLTAGNTRYFWITIDVSSSPGSGVTLGVNATPTLTLSAGSQAGSSTAGGTQTLQSSGTWLGTTNTNWFTASNWCGGVPTSATDVFISSGGNQPNIAASGAVCHNITIGAGATLSITGTFTLTVSGNWTKTGTFTAGTSTVDFNGSGGASIGASNFNNITFSGSGTKTATGILTIGGNVSITNNFTAGSFIHTVAGNWANTGNFTSTGSTVTFNGTSSQAMSGASTTTFNNFTISNTTGVTSSSDLNVNGILSLTTNPSATAGSLAMGTHTLTMGGSATSTGAGDVTGIVTRTTLVAATTYSFGNQFNTIRFQNLGTLPTSLSFKLTIGAAPSWKTGAIERIYEIVQAGASGSFATINVHYLDSELNGNTENTLVFWRDVSPFTPGTEVEFGRSNFNTTQNWIGISSIPVAFLPTSFGTAQATLGNSLLSGTPNGFSEYGMD